MIPIPTDPPERLVLALEIAEVEGIPLAMAMDAAALEEADLATYAAAWDADSRITHIAACVYAALWDRDAAAGLITMEASHVR